MASKRRDAARERRWRDVLKRQAASGLSVRAFCRRERLAESAFYFWRRTLRERDAELAKPAKLRRRTPKFLPIRLTDEPRHASSIAIELAGGRVLRLPEALPADRLAEIVRALEEPFAAGAWR